MPADAASGPVPRRSVTGRLCRIGCAVQELTGWRQAASAFLAGAASVLAMAPYFLWGILFITLPVLVWLIDGSVARSLAPGARSRVRPSARLALRAGIVGWWFGTGYFLAGLFWIGEAFLVEAERFAWALPFAVTLMPAGLGLFHAAAAAAAAVAWRPGLARVLALAVALSAAEWLRGHILTGFPWNVLGYALTAPLALMQSAGLIGIYGLTLVAVPIFAVPLLALAETSCGRLRFRAGLTAALMALAPLPLAWGYGLARLAEGTPPPIEGVRLRLVQPSVPQRDKWRPDRQRDIFFDHLALSQRGPGGGFDGLSGITHVIWPEAAMPFLPLSTPEALQAIGDMLPDGTHLLAGALRADGDPAPAAGRRQAFNSLIAIGPDGRPQAIYDKTHLVPFGEYLPLQPLLQRIGLEKLVGWRGGFSVGQTPRPLLTVPGLPPIGALICYEAIFPGAIVEGAERPQALINITNDGWFGATSGPHQHFHQARVRAVEEGLALVRVANNGITAVIDPLGRVAARLALDERGVIDTHLPGPRPPPPYARYGDSLFALLWLAMLAWPLISLVRQRRARATRRQLQPEVATN
ncbi:MAG: apolipoprotein N-acyltransferase [Hyphomicrobiaceae bacterium]|nr:apolipoprotein N-acyltransferase [Hyphomicrobiaceae bacterium]